LVITGNFNICDSLWDPFFLHHSSISDDLFIIADFFNPGLSLPTNQVLTRYSDNDQNSNSVIDLMFLHCGSSEMDNHSIHPEWRLMLDHVPLTIVILIIEEHINIRKHTIVKDSNEEQVFIKDLSKALRNIDTSNIVNFLCLDRIVNKFASTVENVWTKNSEIVNITVHSKSWWNAKCSNNLDIYRSSRSLED